MIIEMNEGVSFELINNKLIINDEIKKCSNCKVLKKIEMFGPNSAKADGLNSNCIKCNADITRSKSKKRILLKEKLNEIIEMKKNNYYCMFIKQLELLEKDISELLNSNKRVHSKDISEVNLFIEEVNINLNKLIKEQK